MDEIPGWILRAIAGNGHDVDWSGRYCAYAIETVSTTLYPVESIEAFAADGVVVNSFQHYAVSDNHYFDGVQLTSATVYGTVTGYFETDSYFDGVSLTSAEVYGTQVFSEPDTYTAAHTIDQIEVIDAVFISALEEFAADAVVISADLEAA
jgi:hypothetical protein